MNPNIKKKRDKLDLNKQKINLKIIFRVVTFENITLNISTL